MKAVFTLLAILVEMPWLASLVATQPLGVSAERDWLRRGFAHYQRGDYGDAEVSFRRALAQNPDFGEANYNLAQALYQQQRYAEALKYYTKAQQNLPASEHAALAHNQGNTLLKLNQWLAAATLYRKALRLRPGYLPSQKNLSYVLTKLAEQKPKKDVIRNINQLQKKLNENADQSQKEQSDESSEKSDDKNADQANSQSKSNIESPQEQLSASDMEQMLKQLDQSEKQIRGRATSAKAEKMVKTEAKDW